MTSKESLKVLFLTRYPVEGASSRYRVFQYLDSLRALGVKCEVQSFMDREMYAVSFSPGRTPTKIWQMIKAVIRRIRAVKRYRDFDVIYMQRELLPFAPPFLERWLRKKGVRLVFDYDDALFIPMPSRFNPIATFLRSPDKIVEIFRLVDCVIAGNDWLRDQAIARGAHAVTLEVAEDTNRIQMRPPHTDPGPITIGWLGSTSTVKYLHFIAPALQRIARENPNVRFEIMGGGDFTMEGVPWEILPWSLDGELEALKRYHIGLMPLPMKDWAKGKSGGKARTYMAAGVVAVCSAIGYNNELIRHGETGFLCTTLDEWYSTLDRLIKDADLRQRIAEAARADVKSRFSVDGQAANMKKILEDIHNLAAP